MSAFLRACPESSEGMTLSCESAQEEADDGELEEGERDSSSMLEVLGEAPAAAEPGEGALDDPALGQELEAVRIGTQRLHDLERPVGDGGKLFGHDWPAITAVGHDVVDAGPAVVNTLEQHQAGVTILHRGRRDERAQDDAAEVDGDVALLARDLLVRVVARRCRTSPPFSALLTLWLSRIAADGSIVRLACQRAAAKRTA